MGKQQIDLTIVICTVPSRTAKALDLFQRFSEAAPENFEILLIGDNKKRSIGKKREMGLKLAQGKYITWYDDDDDFTDYTMSEFERSIKEDKDVICGYSLAIVNGKPGYVEFDLNNENQEFLPGGFCKRLPFPQGCAWRRELVKDIPFPDTMYNEDWPWALKALKNITNQAKIKKVIHIYNHDSNKSEAIHESEENE